MHDIIDLGPASERTHGLIKGIFREAGLPPDFWIWLA
jgi:hypothetical protein